MHIAVKIQVKHDLYRNIHELSVFVTANIFYLVLKKRSFLSLFLSDIDLL